MSFLHFAGTPDVQPVAIPSSYATHFAHLLGTPIFFVHPVLKMNRMFGKDKRICYVTDYTLNLALSNSELSRSYRIEDIAELLVDPSRLAVGVRMRSRPFRRRTSASPNAYFEMPVDVALFLTGHDKARMYTRLVDALRVTHEHWTGAALPVRELKRKEKFSDLLVLVPDGSRVKQSPAKKSSTNTNTPMTVTVPSTTPTASADSSSTRRAMTGASSSTTLPSPPARPSLPRRTQEEPSHAPHCRGGSDDQRDSRLDTGRERPEAFVEFAQFAEAREELYSAKSALDDLRRSNASFSQLEGLMWVYYDDLPPALQRELCTREELTHQGCLTRCCGSDATEPDDAPKTLHRRRGSASIRSTDATVLGSQMDALLRELNRKEQHIRALENEVRRKARPRADQLDDL